MTFPTSDDQGPSRSSIIEGFENVDLLFQPDVDPPPQPVSLPSAESFSAAVVTPAISGSVHVPSNVNVQGDSLSRRSTRISLNRQSPPALVLSLNTGNQFDLFPEEHEMTQTDTHVYCPAAAVDNLTGTEGSEPLMNTRSSNPRPALQEISSASQGTFQEEHEMNQTGTYLYPLAGAADNVTGVEESQPLMSTGPSELHPSEGDISDTSQGASSGGTLVTPVASNNKPDRQPWKRWSFLAMALALSISLPAGWFLRLRDIKVPSPSADYPLSLDASLVSVDPTGQTMTIDWEVDYACGPQWETNVTCNDVNIYFDQNLLQTQGSGNPPPSNNVATTPIFHINATVGNNANNSYLFNNTQLAYFGNAPFFRTQIALFSRSTWGSKEMTLQEYPFDTYGAQIFIFAQINATGEGFGIILDQVKGVAPGFYVSSSWDPSETENDGVILLQLNITRGTVVRLYTVSIIVAIWLVTLTLLAATVSSAILGRAMAKQVLAIPIGTLFAFTQLRTTLPGAPPGFGATIDFMVILPSLAIITFCSVLMVCVFLFRDDPEVDGPPLWSGIASEWKGVASYWKGLALRYKRWRTRSPPGETSHA